MAVSCDVFGTAARGFEARDRSGPLLGIAAGDDNVGTSSGQRIGNGTAQGTRPADYNGSLARQANRSTRYCAGEDSGISQLDLGLGSANSRSRDGKGDSHPMRDSLASSYSGFQVSIDSGASVRSNPVHWGN